MFLTVLKNVFVNFFFCELVIRVETQMIQTPISRNQVLSMKSVLTLISHSLNQHCMGCTLCHPVNSFPIVYIYCLKL